MSWRWATVLLLVYLIVMHSFWWTERQTVWGEWRKVWEERAMDDWHRQKLAFWQEIQALRPDQIPERRKWVIKRDWRLKRVSDKWRSFR